MKQLIQEGRDLAGKFTKGNKLQVSKKPITKELLEHAIEKVGKRHDTRLIEHIIERAYKNDNVLMKIVDKFVPNITIAERDIKPIQIAIENYYVSAKELPPKQIIEKKIIEAEIVEDKLDTKFKGE